MASSTTINIGKQPKPTNQSAVSVQGVKGSSESEFRTGLVNIAPSSIGLGNVDNTSDADKPVSTAVQEALGGKQATLVSGTNIKTINSASLLGSGDLSIAEEQLPNKTYAPAEFSGLGRKYLQKNIVSDKNILTQAMVSEANTEFVVQYDYDLNDPNGENPITIPANCALKFEGGSIDNGKIIFQDTSLESCKECFGDDLVIEGKVLQEASPEWFTGSDADKIEKAINTFGVVKLAARDYLIDRTINVQHSFTLKGCGIPSNMGKYPPVSGNTLDYSSSRLIPIADIGSILACVNPSGIYVSVALDGVSFMRPTTEAWYSQYTSATANVHGFAFSTPGGPSRPIVIQNCNFRSLNYGIYMYDHNPSLNKSTNVGHLHITGSNISNNKQGIHAEGKKTLGGVMILNSVIEQNTQYGIYAYNPAGSVLENQAVITDFCEIVGCLMEGQTNPIYCSVERGTIILRGNYLENPNGSTVTIRGKNLIWKYQTLVLDSNTASTNIGNGVVYSLSQCGLIDKDNGNAAGSLLMYASKIIGNTNKQVRTSSSNYFGYTPRIDINTTQPLLKGLITPNYIYNDKVQLRYIESSDTQSTITLTEALPAGNYTLVVFGRNLAISLRKQVNGTITAIFDYSYASPISDTEFTVNEIAFTLDEAIPAGAMLRINVKAGSGAFSGFSIYADNGSPHGRYSIDPLDYVTSTRGDVVNPQIGVEWYSKTYNKLTRIADIVNGAAVWKDLDGFTPALSRGTTAQRPALTEIKDDGFEYYDTTINKDITLAFKQGSSTQLAQIMNQETYRSNPIAEGTYVRIRAQQVKISAGLTGVKFVFCKTNNSTDDGIEVPFITLDTSGSGNAYTDYFFAPDPSVYPYLFIKTVYTGYTFFYSIPYTAKWLEADGAVAGVKRSGTTANRPASTDIYVGFEYFDTDLGLKVVWNGSDWIVLPKYEVVSSLPATPDSNTLYLIEES